MDDPSPTNYHRGLIKRFTNHSIPDFLVNQFIDIKLLSSNLPQPPLFFSLSLTQSLFFLSASPPVYLSTYLSIYPSIILLSPSLPLPCKPFFTQFESLNTICLGSLFVLQYFNLIIVSCVCLSLSILSINLSIYLSISSSLSLSLSLSLSQCFSLLRPSSVLALPCLDGIALRAIIRIKRAITVDQPFLMRCDLSILSFTLTLPYAVLHLLDKV